MKTIFLTILIVVVVATVYGAEEAKPKIIESVQLAESTGEDLETAQQFYGGYGGYGGGWGRRRFYGGYGGYGGYRGGFGGGYGRRFGGYGYGWGK